MRAIVFCGGNIIDYSLVKGFIESDDCLICADSGAGHLRWLDFSPHWLVGDFDSVLGDDLSFFKSKGVLIENYDVDKDYTDGELAVRKAIDLGAKEIVIFGATGGRIDHTLGNVFLLEKIYKKDVLAKIISNNQEIMITKDSMELSGFKGDGISLFPLDQKVLGISTKGLKFPLNDETLYRGDTRGVSNEFLGDFAQINVKNGTLLVIKSIT